ncbi:MAG: UPF0149 family protein [Gallionellaceae bacterium]
MSQEEMDELDCFLMSDATSDDTMMLDTLDGYLTAIVVAPTTLNFGQWFSGIWGASRDDLPNFKTMEEARHIIDLIVRQMNGIIWDLEDDPDAFAPILDIFDYEGREYADAEMWAYGFMCGIDLCRDDWQAFFDDPNGMEVLRPIHLLGSNDVTPQEIALTETLEQREELSMQIPASIAWIYRFWLPYRQAMVERMVATTIQRDQPKIGRNDPCPCGSGKKFKKCCGAAAILH